MARRPGPRSVRDEPVPASSGAGPLVQRDYWGVIREPRGRPSELVALLKQRFWQFPPEDLVRFRRADGTEAPLEVGDELEVHIRMAGACRVRVMHTTATSLTLVTLPGHPEAGRITFGAYRNDRGDVILHIRSRARSSSRTRRFGFLVGGEAMQTGTWTDFTPSWRARVSWAPSTPNPEWCGRSRRTGRSPSPPPPSSPLLTRGKGPDMDGLGSAEWRLLRGWSEEELRQRLGRLDDVGRNFAEPPEAMTPDRGWSRLLSEAVLARESPGPPLPEGPFQRARMGITNYEFSDPSIVTAHFDPASPLLGRRMLLEIRVLGLRWLCGVVVGAVRSQAGEDRDTFGFRYETLQGHIERGWEWFLLTRSRTTGEIRCRIEAAWKPGDLPNRWSRAGFRLLGPIYQRTWHRRAQQRLHLLARYGAPTPPSSEPVGHDLPAVVFTSTPGR